MTYIFDDILMRPKPEVKYMKCMASLKFEYIGNFIKYILFYLHRLNNFLSKDESIDLVFCGKLKQKVYSNDRCNTLDLTHKE